jgi:uncharacterized protein YoaH (UPF0181 family)
LSTSSEEPDRVSRKFREHEGIATRRQRAPKAMRDALALSKMATWLAQKKQMKLHTAARLASRYTTGPCTDSIVRRLVKNFRKAVHQYLRTRLALYPDSVILVDDTSNPSDSDSLIDLMERVDLLEETIEKIANLLTSEGQLIERNLEPLEAKDDWQPLPDYSHSDFVTVIREATDALRAIDDLRNHGLSGGAAIDLVGRQLIKRTARQLDKISKEIKRLARDLSRRQRYHQEISDFDFRLDMTFINNRKFFDAFLDAFR